MDFEGPSAKAGNRNSPAEGIPDLKTAAELPMGQVLRCLRSSQFGLTWQEARERLERFGPNELSSQKPPAWPAVLWAALKHPFNAVLAVLGVIALLTGDLKASIVMASMVVLSVGLRFWQELKSEM